MFGFLSVKYVKEFSSLENINMQKVFLSLLAIFHVLSIYITTYNARFVFQTKKNAADNKAYLQASETQRY